MSFALCAWQSAGRLRDLIREWLVVSGVRQRREAERCELRAARVPVGKKAASCHNNIYSFSDPTFSDPTLNFKP